MLTATGLQRSLMLTAAVALCHACRGCFQKTYRWAGCNKITCALRTVHVQCHAAAAHCGSTARSCGPDCAVLTALGVPEAGMLGCSASWCSVCQLLGLVTLLVCHILHNCYAPITAL
jgi:hypothetical protein